MNDIRQVNLSVADQVITDSLTGFYALVPWHELSILHRQAFSRTESMPGYLELQEENLRLRTENERMRKKNK